MTNKDTKRLLIETTKQLLLESDNTISLTARQISSKANVNLAMINYNFQSKDKLIKLAVDEIIKEDFQGTLTNNTGTNPKERLKNLLYSVCEITMKYKELTRLTIPFILLDDEITLPYEILPLVKEHFKDTHSESECKIIAYQIVSGIQLIFYRSQEFYKYSGIDVEKKDQMILLIDLILNTSLGGQ